MKEIIDLLGSYWGIEHGTVATVLVTISIFVLGILINQTIIQFYAYQERRIVRRLSAINIKQLMMYVHRQARNFTGFQEQLVIENNGHYLFKYSVIPSLAVFDEISYSKLYKAYFIGLENARLMPSRKKILAFNNLLRTIEYLKSTHESSILKGEKYIEDNAKFNELRNISIGNAQKIIEGFRLKFNGQLDIREPLGVFYDKRERVIQHYIETPNNTLPHFTQNYVKEMLQLNRDNVELVRRYDSDIKSVALNSYLLESSLRFDNLKNHLEAANHHFGHLTTEYFKNYNSLKGCYKVLVQKQWRSTISKSLSRYKRYLILLILLLFPNK